MILTETQIDTLLRQQSISNEWPWSTNDERVIDKNIKDIVAEIRRKTNVEDKTEYGHYDSGYASFVDCWLYRRDDDFRYRPGDSYYGLVVLFSRLSNYYVIGQGKKSWDKTGGASYLPDFDFVDNIDHQPVAELAPRVIDILNQRGLKQLHKTDLRAKLSRGVSVPTIMAAASVFYHFDALFYWED